MTHRPSLLSQLLMYNHFVILMGVSLSCPINGHALGRPEIPLRCSWDQCQSLCLYLLGGETDMALAYFQRGLLLQIGSALRLYSPHHYIFHFEPLFPFNFNWLHIKTRHTADQLSQAVCSTEIYAEKSAKVVFGNEVYSTLVHKMKVVMSEHRRLMHCWFSGKFP